MNEKMVAEQIERHLRALCVDLPHRHVGSPENRKATGYFYNHVKDLGYEVERQEFDCLDWKGDSAVLETTDLRIEARPGPYSLPFAGGAELVCISTVDELEREDITGKGVLLHGEIATEQIMPKNFVFYNPDHHQKIVSLLEKGNPAFIVSATGKNPFTAGSSYPFPLFEDGDLDIPNVYMKDVEGEQLLYSTGKNIKLNLQSQRIPARAENIILRKGDFSKSKILLTAHIDSKQTTPGALDNATGVAVLLTLAELLNGVNKHAGIEIVPFNGEDYYAVPGQMHYLARYPEGFGDIRLVINLDGAGYTDGDNAWSIYNEDSVLEDLAQQHFTAEFGFIHGDQWVQGDHSMFVMQGVKAIAITSEKFPYLCTEITHTPEDHIGQVDITKLANITMALENLVLSM